MGLYTIWVKTGDQNLAGTDSNVSIQLTGTKLQTERIHLPPQDIFAFEAGSTDKFMLEAPDLGDLTACCIGHDNAEGDSGWYVVEVRVRDHDSGKEWTFPFNMWLGVEESGKLWDCVEA
jgi:hypothetical protein